MQKSKFLSKTDINNFNDPYYCVVLEDGPSHFLSAVGGSYESGSSILYFSPADMPAFYQTLPFLVRYYKVSIRIIENPHPSPF